MGLGNGDIFAMGAPFVVLLSMHFLGPGLTVPITIFTSFLGVIVYNQQIVDLRMKDQEIERIKEEKTEIPEEERELTRSMLVTSTRMLNGIKEIRVKPMMAKSEREEMEHRLELCKNIAYDCKSTAKLKDRREAERQKEAKER